jgi:uncharacterized metal-binding protein YceD (DUF177 family)
MSTPLVWSHRVTEIADAGLDNSRIATLDERVGLAQALDVLSCEEAKADYRIRALGEGCYRMTGKISALLTQKCVVTLEPVPERIEEDIDIEFRPPASLPEADAAEAEVLSAPDIEPLEHGSFDVGRVVFETLSAALDAYPRKKGARFDWEDPAGAAETSGPFAALKKLKGEP